MITMVVIPVPVRVEENQAMLINAIWFTSVKVSVDCCFFVIPSSKLVGVFTRHDSEVYPGTAILVYHEILEQIVILLVPNDRHVKAETLALQPIGLVVGTLIDHHIAPFEWLGALDSNVLGMVATLICGLT
jgi:hypothetical protein